MARAVMVVLNLLVVYGAPSDGTVARAAENSGAGYRRQTPERAGQRERRHNEWGSARAGLLPTRGDARISMGLCPEGVWGGSGAILSSIGRL